MSTIPENLLPTETSSDVEEIQLMFTRLLDASGRSKKKLISSLLLKISNIYGLQTAIDSKISKKATGSPNFITKFLTTGDIDFSTFKIDTFTSLVAINDITSNGFYTASGTGSGFNSTVWGSTYSLVQMNNQQLVFTSTGIWMRNYSGSWSYPVYVGGATQNIVVTYAEAAALIAGGGLSVGAVYSIEDFAVTGYSKIILTAATASTFFDEGNALQACPVGRYGPVSVGGDTEYFDGAWSSTGTFTNGHYVVHYGRIYLHLTSATGTSTNYVLDSTNWSYRDPATYPELYNFEWHGVNYDFTNNFVRQEWDKNGNRFGDIVEPSDGFKCWMNDWGLEYSFVSGSKCICRNNQLTRFYGITPTGDTEDVTEIYIEENRGVGIISNVRMRVNPSTAGDCKFYLSHNFFESQGLVGDLTITSINPPKIYDLDLYIDAPYPNCVIRVNANKFFGGGTITGNYQIQLNNSIDISYNNILGNISSSIGSGGMYYVFVRRSIIYGNLVLSGASFINHFNDSFVGYGATVTLYGSNVLVTNSVYLSTRTITASETIRTMSGKISGSIMIEAGTFTVPSGASFSSPTYVTGCQTTSSRANGVTVNLTNRSFTIIHTGWYRLPRTASAAVSAACIFEAMAYKNGTTPIPEWSNKKKYASTDSWQVSAIPDYPVYLTAGDVITIKYRHDNGGTITVTLGQINAILDYDN